MENNTQNRIAKIAIVVLSIALVVAIAVAGVLAKYTATASGTSTATVASWSIKVGNTEIATASPASITFDLFSTIKEEDTTTDENNVTANKIAPGTGGAFVVEVQNDSEVDAKYDIDFAITNNNSIPLEFSVNNINWVSDITTLGASNISLPMGSNTSVDTTIYWRWAYDVTASQDEADTALGIAARTSAPTATVTATITATQVD